MAVYLFAIYLQPVIIDAFGPHQGIQFLNDVKGKMDQSSSLLYASHEFTAAFLEEVIFGAFFINSLDLKKKKIQKTDPPI